MVTIEPRPDVRPRAPAGADTGPEHPRRLQLVLTALFVFGPALVLAFAVARFWGHGVGWLDLILALVLYAVVGHAVTIGFHRLLAHRSFEASRPLKIALSVAGSFAFQGGVISWVAQHRRHHSFTERPGDPHSPLEYGVGFGARLRGLWHAHMGWFFEYQPNYERRFAADLLADRDLVVINALFPLWCVLSLALPFALGWMLGGGLVAGLTALLWAGLVRVCVLQHVTWSVNSICHTFGKRPFRTRDHSTNFAPLAVVTMGESWHNAHHAFPQSARHGVDAGQLDSSAALIRLFERARLAHHAHWPDADLLARRRV
jgi:stearoyl-CoA desaturase (delta-9 desaturase)